jgi:DNA polymerase elongation subunit (family B)
VYAYFRDGPPVLSWFYHGKIPTRMISYREHMYDTSAAGQFMMKQWQGTNSAILCAWVMLKRSQHRLSDYTLRGVLTYFFRGNAEYQKIDLDHETMHDHMESQDPARLWQVAKYCCRDADAVLFLHDKLCTEVNMRQSGALLRTPIEVQADCGMQRLLLNMMFAELEGAYIINRFQRDVFAYEGAVVIEPITGFYKDPVHCVPAFVPRSPALVMPAATPSHECAIGG